MSRPHPTPEEEHKYRLWGVNTFPMTRVETMALCAFNVFMSLLIIYEIW